MRKRQILIKLYLITFIFFSIYFLIFTEDCTLHYSRHGTIDISGWYFVLTCAIHYLTPLLIILVSGNLQIDSKNRLFTRQYRVITLSLILIAVATFGPCENFQHGFFNFIFTLGSWVLRLVSYILMLDLIIKYFSIYLNNKRKQI